MKGKVSEDINKQWQLSEKCDWQMFLKSYLVEVYQKIPWQNLYFNLHLKQYMWLNAHTIRIPLIFAFCFTMESGFSPQVKIVDRVLFMTIPGTCFALIGGTIATYK